MKKCSRCKEITNNFAKNSAKKDGLQTHCRKCVKETNAEYYKRTPNKNKDRQASREKSREKAQKFVAEYLMNNPCVDCGEKDFIVLEFDHISGKKAHNISDMVRRGLSIKKIQEEIQKCEVRCANCHRRVTYSRISSWRNSFKPL